MELDWGWGSRFFEQTHKRDLANVNGEIHKPNHRNMQTQTQIWCELDMCEDWRVGTNGKHNLKCKT